jgi:ubiquinone/menaquinone biosynthesis C-methylase UbiE
MTGARGYLPAAGRDLFLPLYDPITRLFGFQRALQALVAQAQLEPHHAVLDIGCGTGTLAVLIKRLHPRIGVTGLDPDPRALARAKRKAARARVAVGFERGFAESLPYADAAFDRVFSSMMFHHLGRDQRPAALAEARRVLKPGGRLEFLDFAGGTHSLLAQILHGRTLNAAAADRLLRRMAEAGFVDARRVASRGTVMGAIAYYQASALPARVTRSRTSFHNWCTCSTPPNAP